jgi:hypothetical protein
MRDVVQKVIIFMETKKKQKSKIIYEDIYTHSYMFFANFWVLALWGRKYNSVEKALIYVNTLSRYEIKYGTLCSLTVMISDVLA